MTYDEGGHRNNEETPQDVNMSSNNEGMSTSSPTGSYGEIIGQATVSVPQEDQEKLTPLNELSGLYAERESYQSPLCPSTTKMISETVRKSSADDGYTSFPIRSTLIDRPVLDKTLRCEFALFPPFCDIQRLSTLSNASWALIAGHLTNSTKVIVGIPAFGESTSVHNIESGTALQPAPIPLLIDWRPEQSVMDYLKHVQSRIADVTTLGGAGSQLLTSGYPVNYNAGHLQTLIVVETNEISPGSINGTREVQLRQYDYKKKYACAALVIEIRLQKTGIVAVASFDTRALGPSLVYNLLKRLEYVMEQLFRVSSDHVLADIDMVTSEDLEQIWQWNDPIPAPVERCMHEMVQEQCRLQPNTLAVDAWDGRLTYRELDQLSNRLACHLVDRGVEPDMFVPLCFHKSMWMPVTAMGVLKAGGAFVLLEPSFPEQRLRAIVEETEASIVLASSTTMALSLRLLDNVIQVDSELFNCLTFSANRLPQLQPSSSAMFGVFTSGSTGKPKGAVLTHANYCSALTYQLDLLGFKKDSRVFDFASYAFDVSVHNIFASLASGACLCIPSEEKRLEDICKSISDMRATIVHLTPSVARLIQPEKVPLLQTVIFTGEPLSVEDVEQWWGKTNIVNEYGPAECSINTINSNPSSPEEATLIGKGVGVAVWIVDPSNHDLLVPIGSVGELLIEGALVGRGYINETEKNAAAFIENPKWLLHGRPGRPGRQGRLYKTGDLVKYGENGNLAFVGRKDTQVKIYGQRVDLREVEHWIQSCGQGAGQVVAEMIAPRADDHDPAPALVAFLRNEHTALDGSLCPNSTEAILRPVPDEVEARLSKHLPNYMVPKVFIVLSKFPMTATGKTDRMQLRKIGSSFSLEQLAEVRAKTWAGPKRQPLSDMERLLCDVWSKVLGLERRSIGPESNFFHLGGDSIAAMKSVGEARKSGIKVAVADVFRHPSLQDLSRQSKYIEDNSLDHIKPFELLGEEFNRLAFLKDASHQYGIDPSAIYDAYPCTPLQEGLMSLTAKRPGDYIEQMILELGEDVKIDNLWAAWKHVACVTPILRTRLVHHNDLGLMQLVIEEDTSWTDATGLDEYLDADRKRSMNLGEPLSRYGLVRDETGEPKWFVWSIHHAIYDGWSVQLILDAAYRAYSGQEVEQGPQFQEFIKYVQQQRHQNQKRVVEYWQKTLEGFEGAQFPPVVPSVQQPVANTAVRHCIPNPPNGRVGVTMSMLIRAAWALVVGRMANSDDVVYGSTLYGRNASVAGLDELAAPTIATVPLRIRLSSKKTVSEYLEAIQREATTMIPFEQTGLQEIAQMSDSCRMACKFQTLLVIQPEEHSQGKGPLGTWQVRSQEQWFSTYPLTLELWLGTDHITASAMFDSRIIESWVVRKMLQRLEGVMYQLNHATSSQLLGDITILTTEDLEQIWEWNKTIPTPVNRCVHEIIHDKVQHRPNAPAICAWDGEITYSELNRLADKLSGRLTELGVGPHLLVPLCFEKSLWTAVAILGVIKSGGGFVLLDASLPEQRLRSIMKQIKGDLVITCPSQQALCSRLGAETITLSWGFFSTLKDYEAGLQIQSYSPSSILYAVFTSGSTGIPKGVLITHANMASALYYQSEVMGLSEDSRLYDFASYSFDVAISNMFTVLAAGGCLCVPSEEHRKNNLEGSIISLRANALDLTPSIAQLLSPARLPNVRSLTLGGEPVLATAVEQWFGKLQIRNAYGPSECTPTCIVNHNPSSPEQATEIGNGVGIVTWVVDPSNHEVLLPPGCTGELLLEGPLVGPGYLDDGEKTAAAFVHDPVWLTKGTHNRSGRHGLLYKTGDLAKYHENGTLSFVRRKDTTQIKLRGQRVELGEVEHILRSHSCVIDAVAASQCDDKLGAWIAGFVTIRADGQKEHQGDEEYEQQQIQSWEDQFDGETYTSIEEIPREAIGRDFIGWTSMYDGSDLDKGEMNEWLNDTINTILDGGPAGHVLEIGCGSGMMLFNLANKGLQSYIGIEPSKRAVDATASIVKSIPHLKERVRIVKGTGEDLQQLGTPISPDLVVINSVIQYFPSQKYLVKLIQDILELRSVQTIFFGDVRSHALHKEFLALRALSIVGETASREEIGQVLSNLHRAEPELLLDPEFFTSLPARLPGHIAHVEILPKKMEATNELSSFRYGAVVHVDLKHGQIRDIDAKSWVSYTSQGLDCKSLLALLKDWPHAADTIAISDIPHSKTVFATKLIDELENGASEARHGRHWAEFIRQDAKQCCALSAIDLVKLAKEAGYRAEVSWARQYSQRGGLDAVFHRFITDNDARRVLFRFPIDHTNRPFHLLSSKPLRRRAEMNIQRELEARLRCQLPSHMIPQTITILDRMPISHNGKVDRQILADSVQRQWTGQERKRWPTTDTGKELQRIWSHVLNISPDSIGLDDGFVHFGGNSLHAMKIVHMARQAGINLKVTDMFRHSETTIGRLLLDCCCDDTPGKSTSADPVHWTYLMAAIDEKDKCLAAIQAGAKPRLVDGDIQADPDELFTVLLTGANGFIGTQILRQLLEHGRVDRVICIVRGESTSVARHRTIEAAQKALWWTEFHQEMLEVWPGDLSAPRLGLDDAKWRLLAEGKAVNIIIHNGASVNFVKGYAALEAVNVNSTVEMMSVVTRNPGMRFIYVSSARSQDPMEEEEEDMARVLTENPNGYNQTKFVAEALVRRAASRSSPRQHQFMVVSPGLVVGTPTEGVANADDWLWRMAAACIRVGVYNVDDSDKWIPLCDVGTIAAVIIHAALGHPSSSTTVTQVRGGLTMGEFWETLATAGYPLTGTRVAECTAAIREDILANREKHPLGVLEDMLQDLDDTTNVQWAASWRKNGLCSPARLKAALCKSAEFLSGVSFLPLPNFVRERLVQETSMSAFTRSGF
ncbi:peramine synthetase [Metarhizium rileyi]|uniref:Peramine synthetase ppzA n=1 Tax=Metarhizium rileyi (strain RCEF 4871) TaxID=1649241 RepID=PERA_METRR|nr:RecName: Full=Peramine synthetase ppzA; AltName: Full=Nonribosomal peptide synthetase ppzA; Short=NRPS ppzA; AltName: Full=Pyrrolopyrazine biosynthesis cluster protein A [Metarhizium rileyi RCEF 4871]OAA37396.1 peramine synthetase [Metarhizium rileyi RCEF 4871]